MRPKPKAAEAREPSDGEAPLPALLSWVLVAFTIEFDNEFEHRTPHSTTRFRSSAAQNGPWLASMVMHSNFMRLVSDQGITLRELRRQARLQNTSEAGMERWGYVTVLPDAADKRAKPPQADWIVRPTMKGRLARQTWAMLFDEIEKRWQERFGSAVIKNLWAVLTAVVDKLERDLPEYLPVLGYGLVTKVLEERRKVDTNGVTHEATNSTLPALLSKVLLAFALEFEREAPVSIAIACDILRLFAGAPIRLRDLPRLSGVSKEAIAMATSFLRARGFAVIEAERDARRGKVVRLTAEGETAAQTCAHLLVEIEERWQSRFGNTVIDGLRDALGAIVSASDDGESLLLKGLKPHPGNWRASVPPILTLPHFPMVLHRGGYPDGS